MPIIVPIEDNHVGIAGLTDEKLRAADYGARVDRIYRDKPWLLSPQPTKPGYVTGTRSTLP